VSTAFGQYWNRRPDEKTGAELEKVEEKFGPLEMADGQGRSAARPGWTPGAAISVEGADTDRHFAFSVLHSVPPFYFGKTSQMEGGVRRSIQNTEHKMQKSFGANGF
jgi:hypothetical protein